MASEDELYEDLDAWAAGEPLEPNEMVVLPAPDDADQANKLLRARARLVREAARIDDVAAAEMARIRAWQDDRRAGIDRRREHLDRILEGWMRAVNAEDPRRKTVQMPNGELKLRGPAWSVEVVDAGALRAWLWANDPTLLKIDPEPRLGDLKGRVRTDPKAKAQADRPLGLTPRPVSETDDEAWHGIVTRDGEVIPGVVLTRAKRDNFSVR